MAFPWLTLIMTLLSFFLTKAKTGSTSKALLAGAAAGAVTYGVTHHTEWGRENLGTLDGVDFDVDASKASGSSANNVQARDADGNPIVDSAGNPVYEKPTVKAAREEAVSPGIVQTVGSVLSSWGGVGTAAVVGATGAATGSGVFSSDNLMKWLPWAIGGLVVYKVLT